jgi:hypothetical protein
MKNREVILFIGFIIVLKIFCANLFSGFQINKFETKNIFLMYLHQNSSKRYKIYLAK